MIGAADLSVRTLAVERCADVLGMFDIGASLSLLRSAHGVVTSRDLELNKLHHWRFSRIT